MRAQLDASLREEQRAEEEAQVDPMQLALLREAQEEQARWRAEEEPPPLADLDDMYWFASRPHAHAAARHGACAWLLLLSVPPRGAHSERMARRVRDSGEEVARKYLALFQKYLASLDKPPAPLACAQHAGAPGESEIRLLR